MDHRRNQRENKKEYLETYENENIMVQTYQIQQKLLRRKVIAIQADLKKQLRIKRGRALMPSRG